MKKFWIDFLNKLFFDADVRNSMYEIVGICENSKLSGKEKRHQAWEMIEKVGFKVGGWLLELAFMLALSSLKLSKK